MTTAQPATTYRTPEERFAGLPDYSFTPHYLEQAGLRMHYVDEGVGAPVLLLHGEPTWSFLYRKMIPILAKRFRVIAPDYFGFGRSDKPLDPAFYTYDRHSESIGRLVEALDLAELGVVVQDWGGPIGMRLAAEHPERVARLVVMNTGISPGRPPSDAWLVFRDFVRRVGPRLSAGRRTIPRRLRCSACATRWPIGSAQLSCSSRTAIPSSGPRWASGSRN